MKSDHGTFELDVPRDRNGNFEPEIVKKNQTNIRRNGIYFSLLIMIIKA